MDSGWSVPNDIDRTPTETATATATDGWDVPIIEEKPQEQPPRKFQDFSAPHLSYHPRDRNLTSSTLSSASSYVDWQPVW